VSLPEPLAAAEELPLEPAVKLKSFSWRAFGLVASGAVAAALFMTVLQGPLGASYVAVLSDPRTQKPMLFVSAARRSSELQVKTLDPAAQVLADASLELWALPKGGKPKSLGVISGAKAVLHLASSADRALADVPMLAVSLEPKGGSRTGLPSGPVLYSGPCVKDW
jgi:anti-sigma-K factor RskA